MKTFAAAAAIALASVPVSAATIVNVSNAPASWNAVDPGQSLDIGAGTWTTSPSEVAGSVTNHYKSPFDPAGSGAPSGAALPGWEQIRYYTVGSPFLQQSPAIMTFTSVQTYLTILWGSIDTYNAIEFWRNGSRVDTIDGQEVLDAGGTPSGSGAALVGIVESFDEIRFFSNFETLTGTDQPAFEFSHVLASVPLPAGGLLLIGALGGLAVLRRRKTV